MGNTSSSTSSRNRVATHTTDCLRNVVFMGHSDSGKTSLVEAILHQTGAIGRLGTVLAGTTTSDYEAGEKAVQHSVQLSLTHADFEGTRLNMIDTPGYPDFFGDAYCGALAADIACIVINAKTGIGLNTRNAWKLADKHGLARIIVINKVDMDGVDLDALTANIKAAFGSGCVWLRTPNTSGSGYTGNAHALEDDAYADTITEAAVETSEALMEKYLEEGAISLEELRSGILSGVREGVMTPMIATAATSEIGVKDVLEVLSSYCPNPILAKPRLDGDGNPIATDGPFLAQAFKIHQSDFGAQTYIRVLSGTTHGHSTLTILNSEKHERVGDFQYLQGKSPENVDVLVAGDIAVVPKIEGISVGDTITDGKATATLPTISFPEPMVSLAVTPKTRADETKMRPALDRMEREDCTFKTERHDETHELVIKGMSKLHLDTVLARMKERTKVEVETALPKIAYRETIRGKAEARYRHKKQSGGSGEFGEVAIRLAPSDRGDGFVFESKIVGGAISASYLPAVEKGIRQAMEEGVVAGYKFVDATVQVFDGKEHPVDSKEVAFIKAGRGAFKEAVDQAKPVLLEPIMNVKITVPDSHTGDIMGDLARRRSQPQGMEQTEDGTVVMALVPEAELLTYSQDLRSMTSGEGVYTMTFDHYEFMPSDKSAPLIAAYKKARAEGKAGHH